MKKARMDGLYLMLLGSAIFILFGVVLMNSERHVALFDFRTAYYSGACLLQHGCDPFSEHDIDRLYSQKMERAPVNDRDRTVVTRNIYLPSAFAFTVPLALLPFDVGQAIWFILITGGTIVAAFLMWSSAATRAPTLAAVFLCFCLANSGSLVYFGNPAGFVVPLCVLAAWCFISESWILPGIVCLAIGLAFKPHDVGFIWLYFLLAGGLYRRRALQTVVLFIAFTIPAFLWVLHASPNWLQELSANLQLDAAKGGMNDPSAPHGACMLTNMQTLTSFFLDSPRAYNLASYLICAPFILVWTIATWRSKPSLERTWIALAAIAPLSLLPVYHRQYDGKLLILAIPALALLWERRDRLRWLALLTTSAAFLLNGDIPWIIFITAVGKLHLSFEGSSGRLLTAIWDFPIPLSLLAMAAVYLWIYARSSRTGGASDRLIAGEIAETPPTVVS